MLQPTTVRWYRTTIWQTRHWFNLPTIQDFFLKKNYSGSPNPPEVPNWNHQSAESPNLVGTENITNPWNFCTNKKGEKTGPKKPRTGRGIAHRYRSDRTGVQRGLNSFTWKARNRRGGWIWRQKRGGDRTEAFRAAAGVGGEGKLATLILYQCMEKWMMSIMQQEQRSPHAWRSTWCAHVEALAAIIKSSMRDDDVL